jgi:hypothetical protein
MSDIDRKPASRPKLNPMRFVGALAVARGVGRVAGWLTALLCFAITGCKPGPVIWK